MNARPEKKIVQIPNGETKKNNHTTLHAHTIEITVGKSGAVQRFFLAQFRSILTSDACYSHFYPSLKNKKTSRSGTNFSILKHYMVCVDLPSTYRPYVFLPSTFLSLFSSLDCFIRCMSVFFSFLFLVCLVLSPLDHSNSSRFTNKM